MTPICIRCGRDVCNPCSAKPEGRKPVKIVTVAADHQLLRRSHFQRLAMAVRALELTRRDIPNWMADVIFGFDGEIRWPGGRVFTVTDTDIDEAFNDDGSFRWLSDFMLFSDREARQAPQFRVLKRLRLLDLAFRIAHPDRAAWIAK